MRRDNLDGLGVRGKEREHHLQRYVSLPSPIF